MSDTPMDTQKAWQPRSTRAEQDAELDRTKRDEELRGAVARAVDCLASRQRNDHWPSDYSGPLFLLPGLVIAYYVTGSQWSADQKRGMLQYLLNTQNDDGGWGLHSAGPSTVLGTGLNYVAMRLLGVSADQPQAQRARDRLHELGGCERIPSWGRFYLCVLGVFEWRGIHPLCPELWLLPKWAPFHPAKFWCHTRAVFLPMSFLYGHRVVGEETELIKQLRNELFVTPYEEINWTKIRSKFAEEDVYTPHSKVLRLANWLLGLYERCRFKSLRQRALGWVGEMIRHEDASTAFLTIGPVSKALHLVASWHEEPNGARFRKHLERVPDYLWEDADGLRMRAYNGSQVWDVTFASRALSCSRDVVGATASRLDAAMQAAYRFLDAHQVRTNVDQYRRYHRDESAGAWPFSTCEQAWPVSDCTGEAITAAVELEEFAVNAVPRDRLEQATRFLLRAQNSDGGWSEYERSRGGKYLELLNASDVFGDVMIGYSYTECTASCLQSLRAMAQRYPTFEPVDIRRAIARGAKFIGSQQLEHGGFYGGWGVCFTYGTWFAIEGLVAAADRQWRASIDSAVQFLLDRQRDDGAWGEAFESSVQRRYIPADAGNVVQTSWAMLALLSALEARHDRTIHEAVDRGAAFLLRRQRADGGWPRENVTGVFNRNCAVNYDNYQFIFPLWALARLARLGRQS